MFASNSFFRNEWFIYLSIYFCCIYRCTGVCLEKATMIFTISRLTDCFISGRIYSLWNSWSNKTESHGSYRDHSTRKGKACAFSAKQSVLRGKKTAARLSHTLLLEIVFRSMHARVQRLVLPCASYMTSGKPLSSCFSILSKSRWASLEVRKAFWWSRGVYGRSVGVCSLWLLSTEMSSPLPMCLYLINHFKFQSWQEQVPSIRGGIQLSFLCLFFPQHSYSVFRIQTAVCSNEHTLMTNTKHTHTVL